jgi:hypothetical protein
MGMTIDQELAEISDLALKIQANYLARLKAEKIAMLEELDLQIDELKVDDEIYRNFNVKYGIHLEKDLIKKLIKEKINVLNGKGEQWK